jgi:CubicO group peptidase (beta-lactamase class C family)
MLVSWSLAKSVVHALVGILVRDGELALDQRAPVAEWRDDERAAITIDDLLAMSSGLHFVEDYAPKPGVDAETSDVIEMLFGRGVDDVASFAANFALDYEPGTQWSYSSGTSNILARIVTDVVSDLVSGRGEQDPAGRESAMRAFMERELFEPLGMRSADPRFDASGTFIGSSFLYCTARDFARFGYLYLRGGRWNDRQLLPASWVELARTAPTADVPTDETFGYGRHWWLWERQGFPGAFGAHGYENQYIVVDPSRDLVLVRLGKTPEELRANLLPELVDVIAAFGRPD